MIFLVGDTMSQYLNGILEFRIGDFLIWDWRLCFHLTVSSTMMHDLKHRTSSSNGIRSYLTHDKSIKKMTIFLKHFAISISLDMVHTTHP